MYCYNRGEVSAITLLGYADFSLLPDFEDDLLDLVTNLLRDSLAALHLHGQTQGVGQRLTLLLQVNYDQSVLITYSSLN